MMPFPEEFRLVTKPDGMVAVVEIKADDVARAAFAAERAAVRRGFGTVMGRDIDDDPTSAVLVGIAAGAEKATRGAAFAAAHTALLTTTDSVSRRYEITRDVLARDPEFVEHILGRLTRDLAIDALERGMSIVTAPKVRWRQGYAFPTDLSPQRLAQIQEHDGAREYETWQKIPPNDLALTVVLIVSAETRPMIGAARMKVPGMPEPKPEPVPA